VLALLIKLRQQPFLALIQLAIDSYDELMEDKLNKLEAMAEVWRLQLTRPKTGSQAPYLNVP
jgi:hypothetical protein